MRVGQIVSAALTLPWVLVATSTSAIALRPFDYVGPPSIDLAGRCALRIEKPGGTSAGPAIPIAPLRLGALVTRGATSFASGGQGGTSANFEAERRRQAGLPFAPKTFDVVGSTRLEVYAVAITTTPPVYQRLPLARTAPAFEPHSLVFAQATSAETARIVSLQLTIRCVPVAQPKSRIVVAERGATIGCPPLSSLDVFAPGMTAEHVQRLFGGAGCGWKRLAACARPDRPRGQVLFVERRVDSSTYRWVDYDRLAKMHQIA